MAKSNTIYPKTDWYLAKTNCAEGVQTVNKGLLMVNKAKTDWYLAKTDRAEGVQTVNKCLLMVNKAKTDWYLALFTSTKIKHSIIVELSI